MGPTKTQGSGRASMKFQLSLMIARSPFRESLLSFPEPCSSHQWALCLLLQFLDTFLLSLGYLRFVQFFNVRKVWKIHSLGSILPKNMFLALGTLFWGCSLFGSLDFATTSWKIRYQRRILHMSRCPSLYSVDFPRFLWAYLLSTHSATNKLWMT